MNLIKVIGVVWLIVFGYWVFTISNYIDVSYDNQIVLLQAKLDYLDWELSTYGNYSCSYDTPEPTIKFEVIDKESNPNSEPLMVTAYCVSDSIIADNNLKSQIDEVV